jgi:hypothetical protein
LFIIKNMTQTDRYEVNLKGEAAELVRAFVRDSGESLGPESVAKQIADALVIHRWVREKIAERALYLADSDSTSFTEVQFVDSQKS